MFTNKQLNMMTEQIRTQQGFLMNDVAVAFNEDGTCDVYGFWRKKKFHLLACEAEKIMDACKRLTKV